MTIIDRIAESSDGTRTYVDLLTRSLMVIHRCELGDTAEDIAHAYRTRPSAAAVTGGEMPYTFVVQRDGVIEQALLLSDVGPHARRWSPRGFGVAVIGDFRMREPSPAQWEAVRALGHVCTGFLGGCGRIVAHDELEGGMSDATKACPGSWFGMARMRDEIRQADTMRIRCAGLRI